MTAKFYPTGRGNALLLDPNGFCYFVNRKKDNRIYWVCKKGKKNRMKCRGSAVTEGFAILRHTAPDGHNHSPLPEFDNQNQFV